MGYRESHPRIFYVEDAAEAIILAMERYNKSDPVNIGDRVVPFSILREKGLRGIRE